MNQALLLYQVIDTQLIRIYGWEPTQHLKYPLGSCRWWGPRSGDVGLGVFQWIPKDYRFIAC